MNFNPEALIINRPDLVPSGQKYTSWGITLFFWGALLYLWQPLLSVLAWGLNIHLFYNHMILLGGYRTFLRLLVIYLQIIALLGGSLILWARINQWRFRGKERRLGLGDTNLQRMCDELGARVEDVELATQSPIVRVRFLADGKIDAINCQINVEEIYTKS